MYNSTTSPKTPGSNAQDIPTRAPSTNVPENYYSELPVRFGVLFGVLGSLLIMAFIAVLTTTVSADIWQSPRFIASVLMGSGAATGIFPIILGTVIHLASGAAYGAIFAWITPRMPRPFWIVTGLLYGLAIWVIAVLALPLLVEPVGISQTAYFNALIISHVVFGINLGLGGAAGGLMAERREQ